MHPFRLSAPAVGQNQSRRSRAADRSMSGRKFIADGVVQITVVTFGRNPAYVVIDAMTGHRPELPLKLHALCVGSMAALADVDRSGSRTTAVAADECVLPT